MPDRPPELRTFLRASNLSTLELAMLELTNGSQTMGSGADRSITLTSKSAYLWAGIIEAAVRSSATISWKDFRAALEHSVTDLKDELATHYRNYDPLGPESGDMRLFHAFLEHLRVDARLSDLEENVRRAYSDLVDKGLIEDPIKSKLRRGLAVAVLSLVPVSFSNVTSNGHTVSRKVNTLAVRYEASYGKKRAEQHFEFRLLKLVKAFQKDIVDVFGEAVSDGGEQSPMREATHAREKGKKDARARK